MRSPENCTEPTLFVVTGPPGAGKTTIATKLAATAGLPLFSKDQFKDALFDVLGHSDREWSIKVGHVGVELLFEVAATELGVGRSLAVENAFVPRFDEPRFEKLRARHPHETVQIWCTADEDVLYERFRDRSVSGRRHPGHVDDRVDRDGFAVLLRDRGYAPLRIGGVLLEVDTTDIDAIDYGPLLGALGALMR